MFAMLFDMFKWLAKGWWLAIFLFWTRTRIFPPRTQSIPTRNNVRKHLCSFLVSLSIRSNPSHIEGNILNNILNLWTHAILGLTSLMRRLMQASRCSSLFPAIHHSLRVIPYLLRR